MLGVCECVFGWTYAMQTYPEYSQFFAQLAVPWLPSSLPTSPQGLAHLLYPHPVFPPPPLHSPILPPALPLLASLPTAPLLLSLQPFQVEFTVAVFLCPLSGCYLLLSPLPLPTFPGSKAALLPQVKFF
jgi:hypothetical protein